MLGLEDPLAGFLRRLEGTPGEALQLLAGVLVVRVEMAMEVEDVDRIAGKTFENQPISLDPLREH